MKNNKKEVILEFALPDFTKKDVKVRLAKNSANISAEKKLEKKVSRKDFFHQEKTYKSFSYSTTLPAINYKKAKIEFKKGVLKIKAPKKQDSKKLILE